MQQFADWVRTSPIAGKIIAKAGGVPAFNRSQEQEEVEARWRLRDTPSTYEEEYLAAEEVPRWSDRRAELMLGALVVAVVGLLVAMIVFVFIRGWPSFAHNGLSWFTRGGQRRQPAADDLPVGGDPRRRARSTRSTPGR